MTRIFNLESLGEEKIKKFLYFASLLLKEGINFARE